MKDTYRHKGMRANLVEDLENKGIKDKAVLMAINTIPRHFFLDIAFEEWAYQDKAFPIGKKQTISQPFTVAYQTALLDIKKDEKVMEIGTGSGYQAAILALLGAEVYTIERQEFLFLKTKKLLHDMGIRGVRTYFNDGYLGLPQYAPFDKILVTAGARKIPDGLLKQLKINGFMVIPVGAEDEQIMYKVTRLTDREFKTEKLDRFRFVPFLEGVEKEG